MRLLYALGLGALASMAVVSAASASVEGNYVEARTADVYTGACFANSEVQLVGNLAVFGWQVKQGSYAGIRLDGMGVAAAVKANSTLGDRFGEPYPVKAVLIVDERASAAQRIALRGLVQRLTGDLLQDIVRVEAAPIDFEVEGGDIHSRRVRFSAGTLARIETRAIEDGDHTCGHEVTWYDPLSSTDHAMPAYTIDSGYRGQGLNATWTSPYKRSAFVGTFRLSE